MHPPLWKFFFNTCLPLNPLPSPSAMPEKLGTPSAPQLALTLPVTLEELEAESPPLQNDLSMEPDSSPSSLDSTTLTASYMLRPRLPITYNEAALRCLNQRPQVRTLNFLSIPLPMSSNDQSTESSTDASDNPAEVMAGSPHQQDESPTSKARPGHTPMPSGDVPKQTSSV